MAQTSEFRNILRLSSDKCSGAGSGQTLWQSLPNAHSSNSIAQNHIFFGEWKMLVIGIWSDCADIVVYQFTRSHLGQVDIVANLFCSLVLRGPQFFGAIDIDVPPEEVHSRQIRGAKISRADAHKETELVKQFFRFTREMQLEQSHQENIVRETALAQRKTVYLLAKHPEEP